MESLMQRIDRINGTIQEKGIQEMVDHVKLSLVNSKDYTAHYHHIVLSFPFFNEYDVRNQVAVWAAILDHLIKNRIILFSDHELDWKDKNFPGTHFTGSGYTGLNCEMNE